MREFFNKHLPELDDAGQKVVERAWATWIRLRLHFQCQGATLLRPGVALGDFSSKENSIVLFTWSLGQHYLECETSLDPATFFYHKDRKREGNWAEELLEDGVIGPELERRLRIFAQQ